MLLVCSPVKGKLRLDYQVNGTLRVECLERSTLKENYSMTSEL